MYVCLDALASRECFRNVNISLVIAVHYVNADYQITFLVLFVFVQAFYFK